MASQDYHISETIKSVLEPYLSAHAEIRKQELTELKSYINSEISSLKNWVTSELDTLKKQFSDFQTDMNKKQQTLESKLMTKAFVPVGLICSWPVDKNPLDWYNGEGIQAWFDCNGQQYNIQRYPELYSVLGTNKVPDLRGLFLRCRGGNAGALRTKQNDMVGEHDHIVRIYTYINSGARGHIQDESGSYYVDFRTLPGNNMGPETRPVNMAMRFIIRAVA